MTQPLLKEYQNKFAAFVGAKHARATALGRQSLALLLKSSTIGKDDKVGVCSFTCISVIEAVKVVGATPVYLDVDEHLCIDPKEILKHPKDSLKAVILQHTFGNPGKLDGLLSACKKINALVIEDCAHALGCYWNGKPLGQFGEGAIYSFQWGKPYTTGQGGMLTVTSDELINKIDNLISEFALKQSKMTTVKLEFQRKVRSIMIKANLEYKLRSVFKYLKNKGFAKSNLTFDSNAKFEKGYIRIPDRLTIKEGLEQLDNFPRISEQRRNNVKTIEKALDKKKLSKWPQEEQADLILLRYPLFVNNKEEILKKASQKGWNVADWYNSPVHPLKNDSLVKVDYKGTAVESEKLIKQLIHFPTYNITENIRVTIEKLF